MRPSGVASASNWLAPVTPSAPPTFCRGKAGPCCSALPRAGRAGPPSGQPAARRAGHERSSADPGSAAGADQDGRAVQQAGKRRRARRAASSGFQHGCPPSLGPTTRPGSTCIQAGMNVKFSPWTPLSGIVGEQGNAGHVQPGAPAEETSARSAPPRPAPRRRPCAAGAMPACMVPPVASRSSTMHDAVARLDRVRLDLDPVRAVFQRVVEPDHRARAACRACAA